MLGKGELVRDAWGSPKVSQDYSMFHGMFTFDIPPTVWLIEENEVEKTYGTSTRAVSASGALAIKSGATALDTCYVHSRRHVRYQPDRGIKWSAPISFAGANLDGILRAGLIIRDENGIYFKTKGDGFLYACSLSGGVETKEEKIDFPFPMDITVGSIYDIQVGSGAAKFYALNPTTGYSELVHEIRFIGLEGGTKAIEDLALSSSFQAENITQEVSLFAGYVDITSEGGNIDREQYGEYSIEKTVSDGDGLLAINSPLTINGNINTRDLSLARITVSSDKKVTVNAYLTRDPLAITGGSWDSIRVGSFVTGNSTMTAVNIALMEEFSKFRVATGASVSRNNPNPNVIEFFGTHGDYIVIVTETASVANITVTVEWGEQI